MTMTTAESTHTGQIEDISYTQIRISQYGYILQIYHDSLNIYSTPHRNSLNNLCSFCALNYTGISKMETFAEDFLHMSRSVAARLCSFVQVGWNVVGSLILVIIFCFWLRKLGLKEEKVQRLHSHVGDSIHQVKYVLYNESLTKSENAAEKICFSFIFFPR